MTETGPGASVVSRKKGPDPEQTPWMWNSHLQPGASPDHCPSKQAQLVWARVIHPTNQLVGIKELRVHSCMYPFIHSSLHQTFAECPGCGRCSAGLWACERVNTPQYGFANKGPSSQSYGFSSSHVRKWELNYKESWVPKNWCFWTVVLEKTLEGPLDCREIQPVHSEGDQSRIFIGRTDAEAETPKLWPPDAKSWLIGKAPDAGKDWGQEEKGTTEDEMVGWHHWLKGHEFESTLRVGDGQGNLAYCSPWGRKELDTTEWLNWLTKMRYTWKKLNYQKFLQGLKRYIGRSMLHMKRTLLASYHAS